jgi:hypothetical protein
MFRSDLFPDPNPLAKASTAVHPALLIAAPPSVEHTNPLSVAQYNGYVDGAQRAGTTGFIIGAFLGFGLAFTLLRTR